MKESFNFGSDAAKKEKEERKKEKWNKARQAAFLPFSLVHGELTGASSFDLMLSSFLFRTWRSILIRVLNYRAERLMPPLPSPKKYIKTRWTSPPTQSHVRAINSSRSLPKYMFDIWRFIYRGKVSRPPVRDNIVVIAIGWLYDRPPCSSFEHSSFLDGTSYIYVCVIYYIKIKSFTSGIVTILLNRLGDIGLLLIIGLITYYGRWNLSFYKINEFIMIYILLIAFTKRAQIPFSTWLPIAIIAPTPVSSLVHSSTLVTAGIYLLIRYVNLLDFNYKNYIILISRLTILFAGLVANFELDLKKVVAYSTLRQLGFIIRILSIGSTELIFLHLFIQYLNH